MDELLPVTEIAISDYYQAYSEYDILHFIPQNMSVLKFSLHNSKIMDFLPKDDD